MIFIDESGMSTVKAFFWIFYFKNFIFSESIFLPFVFSYLHWIWLVIIDVHLSGYHTDTRPVLQQPAVIVQFYFGLLGQLNHRDPTDSNFEFTTWYTSRDSLFIYKVIWVISYESYFYWSFLSLAIISSSKCSLAGILVQSADGYLELESTFEGFQMSHMIWVKPSVQNDSSLLIAWHRRVMPTHIIDTDCYLLCHCEHKRILN